MLAGKLNDLLSPLKHILQVDDSTGESRKLFLVPLDNPDTPTADVTCMFVAKNLWAVAAIQTDVTLPAGAGLIVINGLAFLSVLSSLPDDSDMVLNLREDALHWKCGKAKGRLSLLGHDSPDDLPEPPDDIVWTPSDKLCNGFNLGALSTSGKTGLSSIGLNGIVIRATQSELTFLSSDNMTASLYSAPAQEGVAGVWTVSFAASEFLYSMRAVDAIGFSDKGIFLSSDDVVASVALVPPLKHDLYATFSPFLERMEVVVKLDRDQINMFAKRVRNLSEDKGKTVVELSTIEGMIQLEFSDAANEATDYMLAENLPKDMNYTIKVEADRLARALTECDSVILDYIDRSLLVFSGENFKYLVSGK